MRISRITLNPWAGATEREVVFAPGVNVVLGPNDTGKSSLFHAIDRVLFTSAKLHKRPFEEQMKRFIPFSGDTARVGIELTDGERAYRLRKTWGHSPSSELSLPGGSVLTDDDRIADELAKILPAPTQTLRTVFLSRQSTLDRTFEDLEQQPETLHGLGDLLRQAVLSTDGVSIDRLRSKLDALHLSYFSRWDAKAQEPEGRRGISNPWQKEVGKILEAYYRKERLSEAYRTSSQFETQLDRLNNELREKDSELHSLQSYLKTHKKAAEDSAKRKVAETAVGALKTQIQALTEDFTAWTTLEITIPAIKAEIQQLSAQVDALSKESEAASGERAKQALRERHALLKQKKTELDECLARGQKLKKVTREDIAKLHRESFELDRLKAGLSAGKLEIVVEAKSRAAVRYVKDLEAETSAEVASGAPLKILAGGRIRLSSGDLEITVRSGDGNFEQIERSLSEAKARFEASLAALQVASIAEAQSFSEEYVAAQDDYKAANKAFKDLLGRDDLAELESRVQALGETKAIRPLEAVINELKPLQTRLGAKEQELATSERQLQALSRKHATQDKAALIALLASRNSELAEKAAVLEACAQVPDGVGNEAEFLRKYQKAESDVAQLSSAVRGLVIQSAQLIQQMPDQSAQELKNQRDEAEEELARTLRTASAVARVREVVARIASGGAGDLYGDLKSRFERNFSAIVGGRYARADQMKDAIPESFEREDGAKVPYSLLSAGMKDAASLSLKLAMAESFLGDKQGFLLLDDPFVDLDPERRMRAAEVIRSFAPRAQVVVFTCHPDHAELLGGNRVAW